MNITKEEALKKIEELKKYVKEKDKSTEIKDDFYWYEEKYKDVDFNKIKSIGGYAYLEGCSSDLSSLESIGGNAYLEGCSSDLNSLESIGGDANLQGCSKKLKKSLAKTLKKCGDIYIEFRDEPMTLDEFKEYASNL